MEMTARTVETSPQAYARAGGLLYLTIIACGLFAEFFVRSALVTAGDAAATAGAIAASGPLFRAGVIADFVMIVSDVALALVFYVLLKPVSAALSLLAAFFRLVQAAALSINLVHQSVAGMLASDPGYASALGTAQSQSLALLFLDAHKYGYYAALVPFAFNCLVLGYLIFRSGYLPRLLGLLMIAAGFAYLGGSFGAFLFPEHEPAIANSPLYVGPAVIAEFSLCLWLLARGVNVDRWRSRQASSEIRSA